MDEEEQQPREEREQQQQKPYQIINNNDDNDIDDEVDEAILMEEFSSRNKRCCFSLPCFGSRSRPTIGSPSSASVWERLQKTAEAEDTWWAGPVNGVKKIREWSELIAGPKWKTFIRRFNRGGSSISNGSGKSGLSKFHYDPLSYSLNFDDGQHENYGDESYGYYFPDFSSRFASVPQSCKSSMDLGRNGIPISA